MTFQEKIKNELTATKTSGLTLFLNILKNDHFIKFIKKEIQQDSKIEIEIKSKATIEAFMASSQKYLQLKTESDLKKFVFAFVSDFDYLMIYKFLMACSIFVLKILKTNFNIVLLPNLLRYWLHIYIDIDFTRNTKNLTYIGDQIALKNKYINIIDEAIVYMYGKGDDILITIMLFILRQNRTKVDEASIYEFMSKDHDMNTLFKIMRDRQNIIDSKPLQNIKTLSIGVNSLVLKRQAVEPKKYNQKKSKTLEVIVDGDGIKLDGVFVILNAETLKFMKDHVGLVTVRNVNLQSTETFKFGIPAFVFAYLTYASLGAYGYRLTLKKSSAPFGDFTKTVNKIYKKTQLRGDLYVLVSIDDDIEFNTEFNDDFAIINSILLNKNNDFVFMPVIPRADSITSYITPTTVLATGAATYFAVVVVGILIIGVGGYAVSKTGLVSTAFSNTIDDFMYGDEFKEHANSETPRHIMPLNPKKHESSYEKLSQLNWSNGVIEKFMNSSFTGYVIENNIQYNHKLTPLYKNVFYDLSAKNGVMYGHYKTQAWVSLNDFINNFNQEIISVYNKENVHFNNQILNMFLKISNDAKTLKKYTKLYKKLNKKQIKNTLTLKIPFVSFVGIEKSKISIVLVSKKKNPDFDSSFFELVDFY